MPPVDPISNIFKSRIPAGLEVGAKVEILGEQGMYLVVRVDERRYVADLMLMGKTARLEQGISFANIRPVREHQSARSGVGWRRILSDQVGSRADD